MRDALAAYVIAGGAPGSYGVLDHLAFGTAERWTLTDPNGDYQFLGLLPGTYTVAEVLSTQQSQERLFALRGDGATATIYEIDPSDGSVLHSFAAPAPVSYVGPQGLAVGPMSLFYVDGSSSGARTLWELNPDTGAVIRSDVVLDAGTTNRVAGVAYLNRKVFLELPEQDSILVWDPVTHTAVTTLSPGVNLGGGLTGAADLGLLFDCNYNGDVYAIDPTTGACGPAVL